MRLKDITKNRVRFGVFILLFAALLLVIVLNFNQFLGFLNWLIDVTMPMIVGGCIAFVLNLIMMALQKYIFKPSLIKKPVLRQAISLIVALLLLVILVFGVLAIALPQLAHSVELLSRSIPRAVTGLREWLTRIMSANPVLSDALSQVRRSTEDIGSNLINFLENGLPKTLGQTYHYATTTVGAVFTFFIGLMFSFYILMSKEKLARQFRQLFYTYLPEKTASKLLYILHVTKDNFNAFIFGQTMEAIILFVMYIVIALIFRLPYSFMLATIIGVFSLIPLFGAYIGWIIGVILLLTVNPWDALTFTIIFFVISQIEGNFIYPRIVGSSIGLPGIWVLAAVTIGGNLMGIVGMIIATPIVALIYTLLSEDSQKRLRKKSYVIPEIINQPDWKNYNPETDTFEDHPVHLTNVLALEEEKEKDERRTDDSVQD